MFINTNEKERFNGGSMSQFKELKVFVSERLLAAASEIQRAIEKTMTDYEEQTTRLKEENDRQRSFLDIILKSKFSHSEGWFVRNARYSGDF